MALATTCPQCKTSFKVVPDQLKLRRGLVRCGVCQHVFSGIDFLRYVDESRRGEATRAGARVAAPADEGLETAFFLPETILAGPRPGGDDTAPRRTAEPEAGDATGPVVGTTDMDLLALGLPAPPSGEAGAEMPDETFADAPADAAFEAPFEAPAQEQSGAAATDDWPPDDGRDESWWTTTIPAPQEAVAGDGPADRHDLAAPLEPALGEALDARIEAPFDLEPEATTGTVTRTETEAETEAGSEAETEAGAATESGPDREAARRAACGSDTDEELATADRAPASEAASLAAHAGVGETLPEIESLTATTPPGLAAAAGDDEPADAVDRVAVARAAAGPLADRRRAGHRAHGDERDERDEESAIDYFSFGHRGVGFVDRHGFLALVGAALLVLLLGLQWTIAQRSMIAARVPALAPLISVVLSPFGLRVEPPRDLESLTIESFELQASAAPGVLAMSALLRNRADYAVKWPSMQLTLTDPANRVLVRKVLGPEDYLRESGGGEGVPPRAEWPVRLALEARDIQPAGYSVILFYP